MNYNAFRLTSVIIGLPLGIALSSTLLWGLGIGIILGQSPNVYYLIKDILNSEWVLHSFSTVGVIEN